MKVCDGVHLKAMNCLLTKIWSRSFNARNTLEFKTHIYPERGDIFYDFLLKESIIWTHFETNIVCIHLLIHGILYHFQPKQTVQLPMAYGTLKPLILGNQTVSPIGMH